MEIVDKADRRRSGGARRRSGRGTDATWKLRQVLVTKTVVWKTIDKGSGASITFLRSVRVDWKSITS